MNTTHSWRLPAAFAVSATAAAAALLLPGGDSAAALVTGVKPYAVSLRNAYETKALLSVGDRVPETSDPSKEYQMVGIPDGLGAHRNDDGTVTVYMNHELVKAAVSEPVVGEALNRGAIVSKLQVDRDGNVISGERAYDLAFIDDTLIGPAALADNDTPGFGRFCSGSLAGPAEGFDRYIYFANEEADAGSSFDPDGGMSVAIFDNEAHALRSLGRFAWENTPVQPRRGDLTVIMGMEDGPSSLDPAVENSQLYMYVGHKDRTPGATVLERNGLVGGTLYVFRSSDAAMNSELPFQDGTVSGEWVAIPDAGDMSQAELEAASDAAGAMMFARPEDGAFNPREKSEFFFVTTGGAAGANVLGRLYSLRLDKDNPTAGADLTVVYNADQVIAAGGDTALSPDNIDASHRYLMVQEDGTSESRSVMASKGRDGSIWRFDLKKVQPVHSVDVASAARVVELDPPGRDGVAVGAGVWETSGIINTHGIFSGGSWLFDAQAHRPTAAPAANTVEDGQLLLLVRRDSK